jgi:hypothetical protein
MAADGHGIPLGWAIDDANRSDVVLLEPTDPEPHDDHGARCAARR